MQMRDAIEIFADAKRAERLQPATIRAYLRVLNALLEFLPVGITVAEVRSTDLNRFMAAQSERERIDPNDVRRKNPKPKKPSRSQGNKLSDKSLMAFYRALSAFFNWAESSVELGRPYSPMGHGKHKAVRPPRLAKKMPKVAKTPDLQAVIDSIPKGTWIDLRDRAIIQLLIDTGIRVGELVKLRLEHLDLAECEIKIEGGKGEKDRFVFFTEETARAIREYLWMLQMVKPGIRLEFLWASAVNRHGGIRETPITSSGVAQMLADRPAAIGLPRINPHSIRHHFGDSAYNERDIPLESVSKLLGHSDPTFTERVYAPLRKSTMKRAYKAGWKSIHSKE